MWTVIMSRDVLDPMICSAPLSGLAIPIGMCVAYDCTVRMSWECNSPKFVPMLYVHDVVADHKYQTSASAICATFIEHTFDF